MERTLSNSKLIYHNTTKELFYVPPRYCFLDLSDRQADSHTHTYTEKHYTIIYLVAILKGPIPSLKTLRLDQEPKSDNP